MVKVYLINKSSGSGDIALHTGGRVSLYPNQSCFLGTDLTDKDKRFYASLNSFGFYLKEEVIDEKPLEEVNTEETKAESVSTDVNTNVGTDVKEESVVEDNNTSDDTPDVTPVEAEEKKEPINPKKLFADLNKENKTSLIEKARGLGLEVSEENTKKEIVTLIMNEISK